MKPVKRNAIVSAVVVALFAAIVALAVAITPMEADPADAATTQGESIEWQVPELSATIMRDDSATHMWKREATFTTEAQAEAYIKARLNITEAA